MANVQRRIVIVAQVFLRWTLSVKKNYRTVAYHNWRHAFNVTQTMFTMLKVSRRNSSCLREAMRCVGAVTSAFFVRYSVILSSILLIQL